ncbi:MAG: signal recognition particle-docking protein FtsY [Bacteroidetes bacterium]|nr:signal recognition particle-docking protein FtsY [Bacteroidota bacterium]
MALFDNINLEKLKAGLSKTKNKLVDRISETFTGKAQVDEELLEEIEEILISSDIGMDTTERIIENTRRSLKEKNSRDRDTFMQTLEEELIKILGKPTDLDEEINKIKSCKPFVLLIIGINGSGKTTTIGKLSSQFKNSGYDVIVGSADTFRAAANEQLEVWANRSKVKIIQSKTGADPSSVAFDTLQAAKQDNADIVIIDTAGRLHTKKNLMEELRKINNVLSKVFLYAPNEVYLVVDGNSGQNALIQAREFSKFTHISGLIVTKLDGTAKGGILFQICDELKIPVKFIGVGEGIDDLQPFVPENYVKALFS